MATVFIETAAGTKYEFIDSDEPGNVVRHTFSANYEWFNKIVVTVSVNNKKVRKVVFNNPSVFDCSEPSGD